MDEKKLLNAKRGLCGLLALLLILAATPAMASEPLDLTDSLDWLVDVTLTGEDGTAFAEDTPPGADCLLTYTFAVPQDAGINAGDTAAIALPSEISTSRGESFQILDDGGAQIASAAYGGKKIIVTFSADINAKAAGAFGVFLNFNEENISGENPVKIVFPLSLGNAKTIGVEFAQETEESAPAFAALDAAALAVTHTVSDGERFDISACEDGDTVIVDAGATATITGSKNVQIKCGASVKLTLDTVASDVSGTNNACALKFTGGDNVLTLGGREYA